MIYEYQFDFTNSPEGAITKAVGILSPLQHIWPFIFENFTRGPFVHRPEKFHNAVGSLAKKST